MSMVRCVALRVQPGIVVMREDHEMSNPIAFSTLEEFLGESRKAFSFLTGYGFDLVPPPPHRAREKFQVWYSKGSFSVVITAEGWGTSLSVHFETPELRAAEIYFTPKADRPSPWRPGKPELSQKQLLYAAAERVGRHCRDLLNGDLTRFTEIAGPLPPYLRPKG